MTKKAIKFLYDQDHDFARTRAFASDREVKEFIEGCFKHKELQNMIRQRKNSSGYIEIVLGLFHVIVGTGVLLWIIQLISAVAFNILHQSSLFCSVLPVILIIFGLWVARDGLKLVIQPLHEYEEAQIRRSYRHLKRSGTITSGEVKVVEILSPDKRRIYFEFDSDHGRVLRRYVVYVTASPIPIAQGDHIAVLYTTGVYSMAVLI